MHHLEHRPDAETFSTVDDLVGHLRSLATIGSDEGMAFSELDHGLQTAAILEAEYPDDAELQVAGLIHDLAHPWDGPGQPDHHRLGAHAVRSLLGERTAALIEAHVDAKRYLVATDAEYGSALSPGSVVTLEAQGGAMSRRRGGRRRTATATGSEPSPCAGPTTGQGRRRGHARARPLGAGHPRGCRRCSTTP